MEGNEKVCRKCCTLNNVNATVCVRCGENLEIQDEDKYNVFKGEIYSEKLLSLFYIIVFSGYLYSAIYYIFPWFYEMLEKFSKTYIFEFYNNKIVTGIAIELIFLVVSYLVNYFVTAIILGIIFNKRFIKREKVNSMCLILFLLKTSLLALMLYYKFPNKEALSLEILISFLVLFPYIRKEIFRKSV